MHTYSVTEPQPRRCVFPFAAEASQVAGLRRAVRAELAVWGMSALADEAQLIVTELASNVVKHVGQGSVATLVLDAGPNQLRVELHDKSGKEPQHLHPSCDEESGRGLQILGALSTAWGTVRTTVGKAIWCELPLALDETRRRVQRATSVMETYGLAFGGPAAWLTHRTVLEESATSLILDMLHWLTAQGLDPGDILDRAQTRHEAARSNTQRCG
ncbi:ATP-binding protein [Streptomyces malaysiensis]|uniref:ATP-binding protein n=1 Tax=Streptomyces malaysiensis TaxID=92644 RepID=UPI0037225A19